MSESSITKKALAEALKNLMAHEPFDKISVSDICDDCGLNRKSFYYHFKDKYDLVNWVFYSEFESGLEEDKYESVWQFLEDIYTYFYRNRNFYVNAFNITGQNSFNDYFIEFFHPIVLKYLNEQFDGSENDKFYALFFADAYRLGIVRWLNDYPEMKPVELIELTKNAVHGVVKRCNDEIVLD